MSRLNLAALGAFMMLSSGVASAVTVEELQSIIALQQARIEKLSADMSELQKKVSTGAADADAKNRSLGAELQKKISELDSKTAAVNSRISNIANGREAVSLLKFSGAQGDATIGYDKGISITAPGGANYGYFIVHQNEILYWKQRPEMFKSLASW